MKNTFLFLLPSYLKYNLIPIIIVILVGLTLYGSYILFTIIYPLLVNMAWRIAFYQYLASYKLKKSINLLILISIQAYRHYSKMFQNIRNKQPLPLYTISPACFYITDPKEIASIGEYLLNEDPNARNLYDKIKINTNDYEDKNMPLLPVEEPLLQDISKLLDADNLLYAHHPSLLLHDARRFPDDHYEVYKGILEKFATVGNDSLLTDYEKKFYAFIFKDDYYEITTLANNVHFWNRFENPDSNFTSLRVEFARVASFKLKKCLSAIRADTSIIGSKLDDYKMDLAQLVNFKLGQVLSYNQWLLKHEPDILIGAKLRELASDRFAPLLLNRNQAAAIDPKQYPCFKYEHIVNQTEYFLPRPRVKHADIYSHAVNYMYQPTEIQLITQGYADFSPSWTEIVFKIITFSF